MKFSCIPPPRLEPGKAWHGLNRNQGVVRKHDEQYQLSTRTKVSSDLRQNRRYPPF
jgi:hypothetical protein